MSRSKNCGDREPADLVAAMGSKISPKVVCDLCQKECVNLAGLQIHRRRVHAEQYMEECAKQAAEKVPRKHAKIEDEELDMLAKVEAELEFYRIEGCALAKNLRLALVESGKTKQPESVVRKIRSNPDFKLKVEQAMNVYPLTRLPYWSVAEEEWNKVRSVNLKVSGISSQSETTQTGTLLESDQFDCPWRLLR